MNVCRKVDLQESWALYLGQSKKGALMDIVISFCPGKQVFVCSVAEKFNTAQSRTHQCWSWKYGCVFERQCVASRSWVEKLCIVDVADVCTLLYQNDRRLPYMHSNLFSYNHGRERHGNIGLPVNSLTCSFSQAGWFLYNIFKREKKKTIQI